MARITIASLQAEIKRLQEEKAEGERARSIACDVASGIAPDATETCKMDGGRYTFDLFRVWGGDSGIVRMNAVYPKNQRANVTFSVLDEIQYPEVPAFLPLRIAIDRLKVMRARIWKCDPTLKSVVYF